MRTGFIDWTENKICLFIFEKKGTGFTLIDSVNVPVEGDLDQSTLKLFTKANIEYVYLSVPASLLSMREIDFPFSDKNKIKDTIPFELEGLLLGNVSDYSIDHIITETAENSSRTLTACMEKTKLRKIIDIFSSIGLEPKVITSLDLRLFNRTTEKLFDAPVIDESLRSEASREELAAPTINLRQGDVAYKGDIDLIKSKLRLTAVLILVLTLLIAFNVTMNRLSIKKQNSILTGEINKLYRNIFPKDTKIVDAARQFRGNLNSLREKKTILGGVPVLDILLDISRDQGEDITLREININENNILVKGTAFSFENVDLYKNILSGSFTDVKVIDSESSPDDKITFSIIMKELLP